MGGRVWYEPVRSTDQFEEGCRQLDVRDYKNKSSYRLVQETYLDEDCVMDSYVGKTLESTDVVKDFSIRLDKAFQDFLTNLGTLYKQVYGNTS